MPNNVFSTLQTCSKQLQSFPSQVVHMLLKQSRLSIYPKRCDFCNQIGSVQVSEHLVSAPVFALEPDSSQEEEGSGHSPTFVLSPGRNVDPRMECWPGQSELLIANDVMEMVFSRLSVLSTTRYGKFAVVFRVSPEYLSRAMSRLAMNVCAVSPPIANYPCIIVFCRDNLNVGMCPDPSSFLRRVWFQDYTRLLSMAESLVLRLNTGTGPGVRLRFYIIISSTHKL